MTHLKPKTILLNSIGFYGICFAIFFLSMFWGMEPLSLASPGEVGSWKVLEQPPICEETDGMHAPDEYVATAVDSQGNVIAVSSYGVIAKYSKIGSRLWKRWLNGETVSIYACDEGEQRLDWSPTDVIVDDDDNIYVLGVKKHSSSDYYINRIFLMKLNPSNGSNVWLEEVSNFDPVSALVWIPPSARPKMRLWHPDSGGTYIVIGSGLYDNSGFFCYDLSGNLIWHKNEGEPTGPFDLDGQRLFKGHLVETYPGSDSYIIAPAIDICTIGSDPQLSCTTVATSPPSDEANPETLDERGDLVCSSHTGRTQKVFMVSTVADPNSSHVNEFAFVTLSYNEQLGVYQASESKFFRRGGLFSPFTLGDHGRGLGLTPKGNIWMVGDWWYDPMASGTKHIYLANISPKAQIIAQYDYGHEKMSFYQAAAYEVATDKNGALVIAGFDQDPSTDKQWLLLSSNLASLSIYHYVMPSFQLNISDPVSPVTGNFADKMVDLNYPTAGIPLSVVRTYASRFAGGQPGRLGYGWHIDMLDMHIKGSPGQNDKATIVWGDGHAVEYMTTKNHTSIFGGNNTYKFTPIGPVDDNIILTAYTNNQTANFMVYIKNINRTIVFGHSENSGQVWYPTTIFKGQNSQAQDAFPLLFSYTANSITVTDSASGKSITFTLDNDRIIKVTGSAGETVSYSYDQNGNLSKVTRADGCIIAYEYDQNHYLTKIIQDGKILVENTYDQDGRVLSQKDEAGNLTTFSYDLSTRKNVVTSPDGVVTTYHYDHQYRITKVEDGLGHAKTYTYDDFGHLTSMTMPDGSVTRFKYDDFGHLIKKTDPHGNTTTYAYDEDGHLTGVTAPTGESASFGYTDDRLISWQNPLGGTYTLSYNGLGKLVSLEDPAGNAVIYTYDQSGLISSKQGRDGSTITYERDAAGRVMKKTFNSGSESITYTFDALGRPISITGALGTVSYTYNDRGYKASETDAFGNTITYGYTDGHLSSISVGAFTITTQRDSVGRPTVVQDSFGHSLSYAYDAQGRLISITGPKGVSVAYGYSTSGLVNEISFRDSQGQVIRTMSITRGPGGRIKAVNDSGAPSPSITPSSLNLGFNEMDRITNATYDASGRLLSYGQDAYTYNTQGRLKSASRGGHVSTFSYDPLGRRVEIVEDGLERHITYAGAAPIMEKDTSGEVSSYFIFGPGISLVINANGTLDYVLFSDFRKNIVSVLDSSGVLISNRLYSPFGVVLGESGTPWPVPFGFLGESGTYTLASGLVLTKTRAYNPSLARFLTPDPARPNPMNIASLNRYLYAYNDPVNLVDTSGLSPFPTGPRWLIPCVGGVAGCNVRPTMHPTNTLNAVALAPMNSWGDGLSGIDVSSSYVADVTPIYSDRDSDNGGGNTQLAPNFTDSSGLVANFYTLASSAGESEPPPGDPVAVAPGDGYVAGISTVPIIAVI